MPSLSIDEPVPDPEGRCCCDAHPGPHRHSIGHVDKKVKSQAVGGFVRLLRWLRPLGSSDQDAELWKGPAADTPAAPRGPTPAPRPGEGSRSPTGSSSPSAGRGVGGDGRSGQGRGLLAAAAARSKSGERDETGAPADEEKRRQLAAKTPLPAVSSSPAEINYAAVLPEKGANNVSISNDEEEAEEEEAASSSSLEMERRAREKEARKNSDSSHSSPESGEDDEPRKKKIPYKEVPIDLRLCGLNKQVLMWNGGRQLVFSGLRPPECLVERGVE